MNFSELQKIYVSRKQNKIWNKIQEQNNTFDK